MTTQFSVGAELDALVAERVMGWTLDLRTRVWHMPECNPVNNRMLMAWPPAPQYAGCSNDYWQPSKRIAYAWEVVEKLRERGYHVDMRGTCTRWACDVWQMDEKRNVHLSGWHAGAETAGLAICTAALQAVDA